MEKTSLDEMRERLNRLEAEMTAELDELIERKREQFRYTIQAGRVRFDAGVRALHRSQRKGVIAYIRSAPISYVLTAPITYALVVPLLFLDLSMTTFQQICFRVYGIKLVRRRDYVTFDRQLLGYLNVIQKINCVYCSYGNGLIAYAREIASRTEQFWCPIKHARRTADPHGRVEDFFDYGDADAYRAGLASIRVKLLD
jgi:hypothetical protein